MGQLDHQVAIITGGASGIGAASARLFVAEGARVLIADVQDDKGAALADELGDAALYQHTDVTDEAHIEATIARAVAVFGRLDVMFNNAGVPGPYTPIADTPTAEADFALNVLLRGVMLGIKHAAPTLIAQGRGSIINTASVAGIEALHAGHVYSAAKAAVINLTRSAAVELGEHHIRVNALCPGAIATPIFGKAFGMSVADSDRTVETVENLYKRVQPIPRTGLPEDIARAAVFLASDNSSFITGHALVVDGGLTCSRTTWSQMQKHNERLTAILQQSAAD